MKKLKLKLDPFCHLRQERCDLYACMLCFCWILFMVSFLTHSKPLTVGLGGYVVDSTSVLIYQAILIHKLTPIKKVWEATVLGAKNFSFFLRGSQ